MFTFKNGCELQFVVFESMSRPHFPISIIFQQNGFWVNGILWIEFIIRNQINKHKLSTVRTGNGK